MTERLRELGAELRAYREKLGMDLDELQVKTKIRKRYLIALEEGDWGILPGEVYARGFVRNYADAVGTDGHALLNQFLAERNESEKPTTREMKAASPVTLPMGNSSKTDQPESTPQKASRPVTPSRKKSSPMGRPVNIHRKSRAIGGGGQVAVVLGTLVVLGAGWYAVTKFNTGKNAVPNTTHTVVVTPPSTPAHNAVSTTTTGGASKAGSTNSLNSTGTPTPNQNVAVVTEAPFNLASDRTVTYSVKVAAPLSVALTAAKDRCWVSVTADNKIIDGSDTISMGQTKTWQAGQSMSIQVGNVPSVTLNINGQSVSLPAVTHPLVVTINKATANQ